jgi:hypothetical protein
MDFLFQKNSWILSSKNIKYSNNILEADLIDNSGHWKYNKLVIHNLLTDKKLINDNGSFKYILTKDEDDYIMNNLYPIYTGQKIPYINIDKCVLLSVDIPKYNKIRNETISILNTYKLPSVNIHLGYTNNNIKKSRFYDLILNKSQRCELTLGMLEIFDNFVNEYKYINENKWLLYFEDDVRPINISKEEDLTKLYNVPIDAELIRPYIGKNEHCNLKHIDYKISYGGGNTHAFYISIQGCKKVLNYAKKYKWKYLCDIDLYKLSKYCGGFPSGYDGWTLNGCGNNNDISPLLDENEKIITYQLSNIIFNQTSISCV